MPHRHAGTFFSTEEDHFLHGPDDGALRLFPTTGTGPASTHRHAL
jgi:hypothetical protein